MIIFSHFRPFPRHFCTTPPVQFFRFTPQNPSQQNEPLQHHDGGRRTKFRRGRPANTHSQQSVSMPLFELELLLVRPENADLPPFSFSSRNSVSFIRKERKKQPTRKSSTITTQREKYVQGDFAKMSIFGRKTSFWVKTGHFRSKQVIFGHFWFKKVILARFRGKKHHFRSFSPISVKFSQNPPLHARSLRRLLRKQP